MFRSLKIVGLSVALLFPASICAQTTGQGFQGGGNSGNGMGGSRGGTSTQGSFGNPNTTLLGATINLQFNQVFGTGASLAPPANFDPFGAFGPSSSGSTSNGPTRATASSVSGTGMSGFGSTGFGTSGSSGFSAAGSGITNSGFGTTGNGSRSQAGVAGVSGAGQFGSTTGLNANRGMTNTLGALGGNLGGGFNRNTLGGAGGVTFLGGGTNFLGGGATGQQQQSPGFTVHMEGVAPSVSPLPLVGAPNVEVQTRLQNAPGLAGAQNLQVETNGTIAVLKGKVSSDSAKRLAAAMLLLEPGINQVDNQLEVVPVTPPKQ